MSNKFYLYKLILVNYFGINGHVFSFSLALSKYR